MLLVVNATKLECRQQKYLHHLLQNFNNLPLPGMEGYYKSPLFEGLDQQTIDCLLDHKCRLRDYAPGELVALQGDVSKSLLIVDKGLLRAEMTDSEGTRVTLEEIIAPRTVAPAFVYATNNCLPLCYPSPKIN